MIYTNKDKTALTDPEPLTFLYLVLPIILWVMETVPHKLSMAIKSSLIHNGAKPGPPGILHL